MSIYLKRILGYREITQLETGSELVLVAELCKYSTLWLNKKVSIKGVKIRQELLRTKYFAYMLNCGVLIDDEYKDSKGTVYKPEEFLTYTLDDLAWKEKSDEAWVFDKGHEPDINSRLAGGNNRNYAYIAMLAMILMYRYINSKKTILHIDNKGHMPFEGEYADILILQKYGNKFADGVTKIEMARSDYQPDWEAYLISNRQLGYMNREYTLDEKINYLKENFEVGDVVLFYTRTRGAKGRTINRLKTCFPAVIREISEWNIVFEIYNCIETTLTRKHRLDEVENEMFTTSDYNAFPTKTERFSILDTGVDRCTFLEQNFFIRVVQQDGTMQWLSDGENDEREFLSTPETIYAVFEDRNVAYNKERFLAEHFGNKKPVYEIYREARMSNVHTV